MLVGEKVKGKLLLFSCLVIPLAILSFGVVSAHPGNTASDGCHYCRTNCDKWGEVYGERHCHGGSTSTATNSAVKEKSDNGFWLWAGGLGVAGYGVYKYYENKKDK